MFHEEKDGKATWERSEVLWSSTVLRCSLDELFETPCRSYEGCKGNCRINNNKNPPSSCGSSKCEQAKGLILFRKVVWKKDEAQERDSVRLCCDKEISHSKIVLQFGEYICKPVRKVLGFRKMLFTSWNPLFLPSPSALVPNDDKIPERWKETMESECFSGRKCRFWIYGWRICMVRALPSFCSHCDDYAIKLRYAQLSIFIHAHMQKIELRECVLCEHFSFFSKRLQLLFSGSLRDDCACDVISRRCWAFRHKLICNPSFKRNFYALELCWRRIFISSSKIALLEQPSRVAWWPCKWNITQMQCSAGQLNKTRQEQKHNFSA